jgi:tetratricopeptide (TPR) repeat protein
LILLRNFGAEIRCDVARDRGCAHRVMLIHCKSRALCFWATSGLAGMSVRIFLSTVSDEFGAYRDQLRGDLTRHNVEVKVQEDFKDYGGVTLDKLDLYIGSCDAVVHLVGDMSGSEAKSASVASILAKYPDLVEKLPPLRQPLERGLGISYTQWESWLALYHGKALLIAKADAAAPRGPRYSPTPASRAAQATHLERLRGVERYPGSMFTSPDNLAKQIAYTTILDLLANQGAAELLEIAHQGGAIQRAEKEGISEFAVRKIVVRLGGGGIAKVDLMPWLDNWIEAAQRELVRRTNEDEAFEAARQEADRRFRAGLDDASSPLMEEFAREERAEQERQVERKHRRIRLLEEAMRFDELAFNAEAVVNKLRLAAEIEGISGENALGNWLFDKADMLHQRGDQKGENAALLVAIAAFRAALTEWTRERVPLQWAATQTNLGNALWTLGERESGTARLEEAVAAHRAALTEYTRERVPLQWAATQNNLGAALQALGGRESGTARLEEAVTAYRAALKEQTRERVPLQWAGTQTNLGATLATLGERESGTARLEEAVAAYRAALKERTRERVPLQWATTQNNLGNVLGILGERESVTARLEEAVTAYRAALKEQTRERVPLQWAGTQNSLGLALATLGGRESGTARLQEAVAAYRDALKERTRERVPLQWATTQNNLGNALRTLGDRESGTARLQEAVAAYRDALQERTRERVPLDWAMTQNNLGNALRTLGGRESGTARLQEAVAAHRDALTEWTRERVPLRWAGTQNNLGLALATLGERESGTARLEEAVAAYRNALTEYTPGRVPLQWATGFGNEGVALMHLAKRTKDAVMAETAVLQIATACETLRDGGHAPFTAYFEARLPQARRIRDALKSP